MKLKKTGIAGTLESSDIQVKIQDNPNSGIEIILHSPVKKQFGKQINKIVLDVIQKYGIEHALIELKDSGALDCTIKARVECALERAFANEKFEVDWEDLAKWTN